MRSYFWSVMHFCWKVPIPFRINPLFARTKKKYISKVGNRSVPKRTQTPIQSRLRALPLPLIKMGRQGFHHDDLEQPPTSLPTSTPTPCCRLHCPCSSRELWTQCSLGWAWPDPRGGHILPWEPNQAHHPPQPSNPSLTKSRPAINPQIRLAASRFTASLRRVCSRHLDFGYPHGRIIGSCLLLPSLRLFPRQRHHPANHHHRLRLAYIKSWEIPTAVL